MMVSRKKYALILAAVCALGLFACGGSSMTDNSTESMISEAETATAEQTTVTMSEETERKMPETSRAEASSHSSQTADYKEQEIWGNSAANVVDAYKRRYKEVVKYDPELTLQEKGDRLGSDDGGAVYIYKAKDGFEIKIFTHKLSQWCKT